MKSFTKRQQEAIRTEGHLLIEAGAGSGKTTTLVGKVLHALGAEVLPGEPVPIPCELSQITAITFTEAAASDLKAALRRAIRAEAQRSGTPVWRRRLYELERARIGTIHSFCGMLLREWGARVGMDPGFGILDETEASLLRRDAAHEELFRALRTGETGAVDLVSELGLAGARRIIESAMGKAAVARAALDRWSDGAAVRLEELRLATEEVGLPWHAHDGESARMAATALRLACAARERLERRLAAERVLDFDGLIASALHLLRTREDIVRALRARLRWLFIDEFQDTDAAQMEIAYRICGLLDEPAAPAPSLCIVGDPKQSIYRFRRADVSVWNRVADDFRRRGHAIVTLDTNFRSRRPILEFVNATFPALMDAPFIRGENPRHEVRYTRLAAARSFPADDGLVEVLTVDGDQTADERRQAEAELIARRIRRMVAGEKLIRERTDDGGERLRAPTWKDITLLFRSRTRAGLYAEALRRHGIPFYLTSGGGFFARREVRDLVLLLTALSDPRDDVAWAGLLRSPWIGLSDESLLRMRLPRTAPLSGMLGMELPGKDGARLGAAREWLRQVQFLRDRVSPSVLVERALERSGYAEYLLLQEGGELALANLHKLIRMADRSGRTLGEVVAWLQERSELAEREPDARLHTAGEDVVVLTTVHGAKGLEWPIVFLCDLERDLAVSRGLRSSLLFDEEAGIALRRKDLDAEGEPVCGGWERLCAREETLDRAEEKRVWYVAATRARDRLLLCGCATGRAAASPPDEGKTPAQWLLSASVLKDDELAYAVGEERWRGSIHSVIEGSAMRREALVPPTRGDLGEAAPLPLPVRSRIGDCPPVRSRQRHSATELMRFADQPDEHRIAYGLGLPSSRRHRTTGLNASGREGPSAREIGNIVHGVLERLREEEDLDLLLERQVVSELGEEGTALLAPEIRVMLRRLIEQTRSHPEVARLLDAEGAETELPFTWLLQVDGEPAFLQGAMDLVGEVEGAAEILDFKTHSIAPGEEQQTAARYDIQRDLYAAALAELTGRAPASAGFFFPATGGHVRTSLQAEGIERFRESILQLLRVLRERS